VTSAVVASLDAHGVSTRDGRRYEADTVIWTAGMHSSPLTAHIPGERDNFGRIVADPYLRAPGAKDVFVTGDTAHAKTDEEGHVAAMSCQHALRLGRVAGYNAAAELIGVEPHPYSQPRYVTCLDLGAWGAVFSEGWDRNVTMVGAVGKATKKQINTAWIYPPPPDRAVALALAAPDYEFVDA
jgi:NADH dehydrogenase